jgi:UDP-N-acetylmuramyl pentapeptide phosphotransferase/UDP-N-acetylglucosamine-1-phosphate transferase
MQLLFLFGSFLLAVSITAFILPQILLFSYKKKLFDEPNERKVHTQAIPRLGGVSFFPTILFSIAFVLGFRYKLGSIIPKSVVEYFVLEGLFIVCGLTLLYIVGIADDLMGVRYRKKFIIQIICATFFPLAGLYINNLYGLFGIYELPGYLAYPLTVLVVVFVTNAINLIDGIDGLASGLSSVSLVILGTFFYHHKLWVYSMIAFVTFGVLIPFFYYNVFGNINRRRKIFMGDTGSLTLGYIISFLVIKYSMYNPDVMPYQHGAIVIAFSTLIIPMFDVVRVVIVRVRQGKGLFTADKNHIHHKFLAMGFTPRKAMMTIIGMAIGFSAMNIFFLKYVTFIVIIDVLLWISLHLLTEGVKINKRDNLDKNKNININKL